MELHGTLHQYLLADVFQLLAQQKATGKLEVRSGTRVGFLILSEGLIVAAQDGDENLQKKLLNALRILRRAPERDVAKLMTSATLPARFCAEIVNRNFLSQEEMQTAVRTTIEDLACSLFSWSQGTYRFESMDSVRQWMIPGIALPADAVVMEAMRRDDESKRLFTNLQDDIVLIPISREQHSGKPPRSLVELFQSPDTHVLSLVDGLTSIGGMVEQSCLCSYRLKETLVRLQQASLVAPLPEKLSQSIQAAMARAKSGPRITLSSLAVSVTASLAAVLVLIILGFFVFQRTLMRTKLILSTQIRTEIEIEQAKRKLTAAKLNYWASAGRAPANVRELIDAQLLRPSDIAPLNAVVDTVQRAKAP